MKSPVWWVLLSVMGSLIGAGILFLVSRPPVGEAVELLPAPTSPALVVYVTGAVATPGVYTMPAGSRVGDPPRRPGRLFPVDAGARGQDIGDGDRSKGIRLRGRHLRVDERVPSGPVQAADRKVPEGSR